MRISIGLSIVLSCVAMSSGRAVAQSAMADMPPICTQSYQQLRSSNPETARRASKIYDACGEAYIVCGLVATRNQGQTNRLDCIAKTVAGAVESIDGNGQAKSGNRQTKAPSGPAAKPDIHSAKHLLPGCEQQVAAPEIMSAKDAYLMGQCLGMVETLMVVGAALSPDFRICVPHDLPVDDAIRVVIKYLEARRPEELQTYFVLMADHALAQAWPCK